MLRPLLRDRKNSYSVLDIETGKKGDVLDIAVFDGDKVSYFTGWGELITFLMDNMEDKRYRKFIAHFGGKFDWVSFVEYLTKQTLIPYEIVNSQSKIVILFVTLQGQRFEFIDSSNVFINTGLAELCRIFDVEHKKVVGVDRGEIELLKRKDPDLYYKYLSHDVVSLYEVCKAFEKYLEIDFFPITIASLSLYLFRRKFLKHYLFKPRDKVDEFISKAYAGGRVECFRSGHYSMVYDYDINSLYPAMMRNAKFPFGTPIRALKFVEDLTGVYQVRFRQDDRTIPPVLWEKDKIDGLVFVYEGEGHFFDAELRLAREKGVVFEVIKGYVWTRSLPLFKEFVDHYYTLRMENKDNALGYACKLILNSLYGKFAQREKKSTIKRLSGEELKKAILDDNTQVKLYDPEHGLYEITRDRRVTHRIINLSAQITSMARAKLGREIFAHAGTIVYCDTDSIHLTEPLPSKVISQRLGDWKLEDEGEGIYTGRKQYYINGRIRFKGMKVIDKLEGGKKLLEREDIEFISRGGVIQQTYSGFSSVKGVLRGRKACKIYKTTKIGQMGRYLSNFHPPLDKH